MRKNYDKSSLSYIFFIFILLFVTPITWAVEVEKIAIKPSKEILHALNRLEVGVLENIVFSKDTNGINFPKDYAFNNNAEQEVLTRFFIGDIHICNLFKKHILVTKKKFTCYFSFYTAEDHIKYMIKKGNVFALALLRSDIYYLQTIDGEMASFGNDWELYPYQFFPNYNQFVSAQNSYKSAQYFCKYVNDENVYYYLGESPKIIYQNIKNNKVYKFIDAVKKIEGCVENIKGFV